MVVLARSVADSPADSVAVWIVGVDLGVCCSYSTNYQCLHCNFLGVAGIDVVAVAVVHADTDTDTDTDTAAAAVNIRKGTTPSKEMMTATTPAKS